VLSLYGAGRSTGVVLESGDGITHAVPVYEGHAIRHAVQRLELGGQDLTRHTHHILSTKSNSENNNNNNNNNNGEIPRIIPFSSESDLEKIRLLKERIGRVAYDYDALDRDEGGVGVGIGFGNTQVTTTTTTTASHQMTDGSVLTLSDRAGYDCCEPLFQPSMIGREESGIHELVYQAISKCGDDESIQRTMWYTVLLSGGNTMFKGIGDRLHKELRTIQEVEALNKLVRVMCWPDRKHYTWLGGSIVGSLDSRPDLRITREEYNESGHRIVHRKCL